MCVCVSVRACLCDCLCGGWVTLHTAGGRGEKQRASTSALSPVPFRVVLQAALKDSGLLASRRRSSEPAFEGKTEPEQEQLLRAHLQAGHGPCQCL